MMTICWDFYSYDADADDDDRFVVWLTEKPSCHPLVVVVLWLAFGCSIGSIATLAQAQTLICVFWYLMDGFLRRFWRMYWWFELELYT